MTGLSPRAELVYAASMFRQDPDAWRARLEAAIEFEVEGELYQQFRTAARRLLKAPESDRAIANEAIGDLIVAIGEDIAARRPHPSAPVAAARRSAPQPARTQAAEIRRPHKLRSEPLVEDGPQPRLPYRDD